MFELRRDLDIVIDVPIPAERASEARLFEFIARLRDRPVPPLFSALPEDRYALCPILCPKPRSIGVSRSHSIVPRSVTKPLLPQWFLCYRPIQGVTYDSSSFLLGVRVVAGSNPAAPTSFRPIPFLTFPASVCGGHFRSLAVPTERMREAAGLLREYINAEKKG